MSTPPIPTNRPSQATLMLLEHRQVHGLLSLTPEEEQQLARHLDQLEGDQRWAEAVTTIGYARSACRWLLDHDGSHWEPDRPRDPADPLYAGDPNYDWDDLRADAQAIVTLLEMAYNRLTADLPQGVQEVLYESPGADDDGPDDEDDDDDVDPEPDEPVMVGTA